MNNIYFFFHTDSFRGSHRYTTEQGAASIWSLLDAKIEHLPILWTVLSTLCESSQRIDDFRLHHRRMIQVPHHMPSTPHILTSRMMCLYHRGWASQETHRTDPMNNTSISMGGPKAGVDWEFSEVDARHMLIGRACQHLPLHRSMPCLSHHNSSQRRHASHKQTRKRL